MFAMIFTVVSALVLLTSTQAAIIANRPEVARQVGLNNDLSVEYYGTTFSFSIDEASSLLYTITSGAYEDYGTAMAQLKGALDYGTDELYTLPAGAVGTGKVVIATTYKGAIALLVEALLTDKSVPGVAATYYGDLDTSAAALVTQLEIVSAGTLAEMATLGGSYYAVLTGELAAYFPKFSYALSFYFAGSS